MAHGATGVQTCPTGEFSDFNISRTSYASISGNLRKPKIAWRSMFSAKVKYSIFPSRALMTEALSAALRVMMRVAPDFRSMRNFISGDVSFMMSIALFIDSSLAGRTMGFSLFCFYVMLLLFCVGTGFGPDWASSASITLLVSGSK